MTPVVGGTPVAGGPILSAFFPSLFASSATCPPPTSFFACGTGSFLTSYLSERTPPYYLHVQRSWDVEM